MKHTWAHVVASKSQASNTELTPMQVIVPEPPMRTESRSLATSDTAEVNITLHDFCEMFEKRTTSIQAEIEHRREKFQSSYAYTKYMQDIQSLETENNDLKKKMHYIKCIADVVKRIQTYLSHDSVSTRSLTYTIKSASKPECKEISWNISEGLHADKLHIDFFIGFDCMIPILDQAIKNDILPRIKRQA